MLRDNETSFANSIALAKERVQMPTQLRKMLESDVAETIKGDGSVAYIASSIPKLTYLDGEGDNTFSLEVQGLITGWSERTIEHSVGRRTLILYDREYQDVRLVLPPTVHTRLPRIESRLEGQWQVIVDGNRPDELHQGIKHFLGLRNASMAYERLMERHGQLVRRRLK